MSADDRATPGALRRARDLLDATPGGGLRLRAVRVVPGRRAPPPARTTVRGWSVWSGQQWLEHRYRQAENPITSPEIIVRTSLQRRVGGYDPALPKAADMEMYMRLAGARRRGLPPGSGPGLLPAARSQHEQGSERRSWTCASARQVFEVVLERYGPRLSDTDRLAETVHRQLGREALWAAGRVYDRGRLRRTELGRRLLGAGANEEPEDDVDELMEFAVECWPELKRLAAVPDAGGAWTARQPGAAVSWSTRRAGGGCAAGCGSTGGSEGYRVEVLRRSLTGRSAPVTRGRRSTSSRPATKSKRAEAHAWGERASTR